MNNNYAQLTEAACRMLDNYNGPYCLESFDPRCIHWLKKHRPDLVRGQLAENFMRSASPISKPLKFLMTHHLVNFLTKPDFIAYKFDDRKNLGTVLVRRLLGVQGVSWTVRTKEDFRASLQEGWLTIFEGFRP